MTEAAGAEAVPSDGGPLAFVADLEAPVLSADDHHHLARVRRLRDGRTVSCVLPFVSHVDHTEHDIKCIVTEQGFATQLGVRSPRVRAHDIIEHCAHPHFRPILREAMTLADAGDEPRISNLDRQSGWLRQYEAACREFPAAG